MWRWTTQLALVSSLAACGGEGGPELVGDLSSESPDVAAPTDTEPLGDVGVLADVEEPDTTIGPSPRTPPVATTVGGSLTITATNGPAFFSPAPGLSLAAVPDFSVGRELFVATWTPGVGTRTLIDGLGPVINAVSCLTCHPGGGRPASLLDNGMVAQGLLMRLGRAEAPAAPDSVFGAQFQPIGVAGVPGEGSVSWHESPDGLGPVFTITPHAPTGQLDAATRIGGRASPHLVGLGLIERVDVEDVLAWADPEDSDGDGISGRPHWVELPSGEQGLGRFGWKGIHASLSTQAAGAFANDMGITSRDEPSDGCTPAQPQCLAAENGGDPEIAAEHLDAVASFLSYLGVAPARRVPNDPVMALGQGVFDYAGCGSCHRETLRTVAAPGVPLYGESIEFNAYTDLLLHDLGPRLGNDIQEGDAGPSEWRTAPLWGIGFVTQFEDVRLMHDGRARSVEEAIYWHGGEAQRARDRFISVSDAEKAALIAFVRSL